MCRCSPDPSVARATGVSTLLFAAFTVFAIGCGRSAVEALDAFALEASARDARPDGPCQWTLAPQVSYPSDGLSSGLSIGDIDGDGALDLLRMGPDDVGLFVNRGDGTFERPRGIPVGRLPTTFALGDFDGDGRLDLAVVYAYQTKGVSDRIQLFLNQGDGTFSPAATYPTNGGATTIITSDFNGDGRADLALADNFGTVSVLLQEADGTFGALVTYPAGGSALSIAASDLDRNGALDIVAADSFGISVLFNPGNGTFAEPVLYPNDPDLYPSGMTCWGSGSVTAGDLDGDGFPDIVLSCNQAGNIAVRLNHRDGTFGDLTLYMSVTWPSDVALGDFFGRGSVDIAVADQFSEATSIGVLPNGGAGTFGPQETLAATEPGVVASGDLNGDGHPDLATTGGPVVSVFLSACE